MFTNNKGVQYSVFIWQQKQTTINSLDFIIAVIHCLSKLNIRATKRRFCGTVAGNEALFKDLHKIYNKGKVFYAFLSLGHCLHFQAM